MLWIHFHFTTKLFLYMHKNSSFHYATYDIIYNFKKGLLFLTKIASWIVLTTPPSISHSKGLLFSSVQSPLEENPFTSNSSNMAEILRCTYHCPFETLSLVKAAYCMFQNCWISRVGSIGKHFFVPIKETEFPFGSYHLFHCFDRFLVSGFDKECGEVRLEHCADRYTVAHPAEEDQT